MAIDVEEYFRKYGPMVLRRCRFLLKNEEWAQDAMQDVFLKLMNYQDRLKDQYPSSLLFRMATNVCINIIRSRTRKAETGDEILARISTKEDLEGEYIIRDTLDRIFKREPESTRSIAVYHFIDKMTYEQISREVGMSVSGIRKRLRTLKEKLGKIEEYGVNIG